MAEPPSYHDLHITTPRMPRIRLFDLPYNIQVICTRTAGWTVWRVQPGEVSQQIAGEFAGPDQWLVLDVAGRVICDSRPRDTQG